MREESMRVLRPTLVMVNNKMVVASMRDGRGVDEISIANICSRRVFNRSRVSPITGP